MPNLRAVPSSLSAPSGAGRPSRPFLMFINMAHALMTCGSI
ncbi:hypothetical protein GXY_01023 [Novacetimonas hansenii ATCC 23769]|uniref:Uncharacterized protein n=1 Tax=Novacetimonas hansenii ATCC 23769 TaxID=714995 RepID=D5QAT3_NOVHA|nr:hypothetical protein GXY_01023 [Novacetimonas hansenii ATCC 23769]